MALLYFLSMEYRDTTNNNNNNNNNNTKKLKTKVTEKRKDGPGFDGKIQAGSLLKKLDQSSANDSSVRIVQHFYLLQPVLKNSLFMPKPINIICEISLQTESCR